MKLGFPRSRHRVIGVNVLLHILRDVCATQAILAIKSFEACFFEINSESGTKLWLNIPIVEYKMKLNVIMV